MDVLDIWKHHESIGVQRGENRQNLERHSPKRKEYSGTQVFYRAIGRRKLAYVKQLLFPRFSSSQIFFLQHKGGLEFEAFFTTSHIGLGEGSAQGPSEEGEALSELKNSILGAKKWLANPAATNLLPCNRTGRTCTGDSVTAINLSVLVSQGKFQKVC